MSFIKEQINFSRGFPNDKKTMALSNRLTILTRVFALVKIKAHLDHSSADLPVSPYICWGI